MENISGAHFEEKPKDKKPLIALIVIAAIAGLGGILFGASRGTPSPSTTPTPTIGVSNTFLSPHTLVYGFWTSNSSEIRGYSLENGNNYRIASLPFAIKKVSIASFDSLLFINNTDAQDHGKGIVLYSISSKNSQVVTTAATGCGIDDYVISPNKRYIATWEVCFAPSSQVLLGGKSKVYTIDLSNSKNTLIYDEVSSSTTPVHYPRAITDSGEVFLDTFLPNSGAGWAHGMSTSNLTGIQKNDIPSMTNGTYGTQPVLSPNGTSLAFAGYDGSQGNGTDIVQSNTRRALVTTNTIELLNTSTQQRTKLINIPNTKIYRALGWDLSGETLFFASVSPGSSEVEIDEYDVSQHTLKKISIPPTSNVGIYGLLSSNLALMGTPSTSASTLGNLGSTYLAPATNFSVLDIQTQKLTTLNLSGGYMQYIALLPASNLPNLPTTSQGQERGVLIASFQVKAELQDIRSKQQSDPPPPQILPRPDATIIPTPTFERRSATTNCNLNQGGLIPCSCQYGGTRAGGLNPAWDVSCSGSPLYVYGKEGISMDVTVGTRILSTEPSYKDKYSITLLQNNIVSIDGRTHESIKFTYTPALNPLKPPPYGTVVSFASLKTVVTEYAHNLGLNEKETADLVDFAEKEVNTPYVLVSFYDEKQSKEILPLAFNPKPDTYINIVFYFQSFESAPSFSLTPPTFPPIKKRGPLTTVEISAIIK